MGNENENGNLMDEFEEAFQHCLLALTKQEPNTGTNKEEIELEVQMTTSRFIDVARQMEAFFLQKRFLVSTLKPDMLIKDENQDLRMEIARKEQLLNKHYNRLEEWKAVLSDLQNIVHSRPPPQMPDGAQQLGGPIGGLGPNRPGGMVPNMQGFGPSGVQLPPGQQQHLQNQSQQQMKWRK